MWKIRVCINDTHNVDHINGQWKVEKYGNLQVTQEGILTGEYKQWLYVYRILDEVTK